MRHYNDVMTILRGLRAAATANLNDSSGGPWGGKGGGSSSGNGSGGNGSGSGSGGGGSGGGGSGSGGPRSPWSQPPEPPRGGKGASTLDEFLRRARDMRGGLPTGNSPLRWAAWGLLALVVLWIVSTSFHQIEPAERGVVTRFGRYERTLESGVSMTLPSPIERVQTIDVQNIRTIDIPGGAGEKLVLTGDQNIIDLEYAVRWTIRDPELYLFQNVDTDSTIRSVAESTMRAALANVSLNDAIGPGRAAIEQEVTQQMQTLLDGYRAGVSIRGVAIKQTDPPEAVLDAFKEVSAAQQTAKTSVNQARAYAQQVLAKAQGDAGSFDRVYAQYKLAPDVTRRRMYYETMERVLSKVDKTIVETPGVTPYLPLPALRRPADGNSTGAAQ